ncbi:MAG: bifunctional hydroxymethylpyrimidine kinase/phosphomethylpyrimidine kinase [Methanothrix sp.]|nr:bifunctional hydroxymethylpyrimidine kinase/phosphomethylpyrimidine kinase [Methanothrix sp.]
MAKVVLTIGGSDSGGGAGVQADIKTFSVLGLHGTSAITAVTAQNTLGVQRVFPLGPEEVRAQLESITSDFHVAYAKTGMLHSAEIVVAVADHLMAEGIPFVLDPVIEAEAGGRLLSDDALEAVKRHLIPASRVVTPNILEAEALTGVRVVDIATADRAAERIISLGAAAVIVKGGHLDCTDLVRQGSQVCTLQGERASGGTHGVGCTYSAALTSFLALGHPLREAAIRAKGFAAASVAGSKGVGHGAGPVDQSAGLRDEADRFRVLTDVSEAVELLMAEPSLEALIPEVGSNIGMGTERASSIQDVAAVEGRLVRAGGRIRPGCVRFGASSHISRLILEIMRFYPAARAAMNLSIRSLPACESIGLTIAEFDRGMEPAGGDTMSWGAREAIEAAGCLPDVIWDRGAVGKEPMVRLIGRSATEVARRAQELARLSRDGKI